MRWPSRSSRGASGPDGCTPAARPEKTAPLAFERERTVHLAPGTYRWVSLKTFRIDADQSDGDLLDTLIRHPQYRDHYAGGSPGSQGPHRLHGPYQLDFISTEGFHPIDSHEAQTMLQRWVAEVHDPVPTVLQDELNQCVYSVLPGATVYRLADLHADSVHAWGWVVGSSGGFHELVATDRTSGLLTLIVASDD